MKRKIIFTLLLVFALSALTAGYFYREHSRAEAEFKALNQAFEARRNPEESIRIYRKNWPVIKNRRYEALYNLGNLSFRRSQEQIPKDFQFLLAAAEYYKEALRLKPDFFPAKRNLEVAAALIAALRSGQEELQNKPEQGKLGNESPLEKRPGLEPNVRYRP